MHLQDIVFQNHPPSPPKSKMVGPLNIFRKFPLIAEYFRWRSEDVPIIHQRIKYNLRDKLDISEIIDIFTSEDMESTPLESRI